MFAFMLRHYYHFNLDQECAFEGNLSLPSYHTLVYMAEWCRDTSAGLILVKTKPRGALQKCTECTAETSGRLVRGIRLGSA